MDDDLTDEERSDQVRNVLFKALGVLVVIGVLIFLGTTIMVHALGLNDDSSADRSVPAGPARQAVALDRAAGPGSDEPSDEPSASDSASPNDGKRGDIELSISPIMAKPMERVNLTGTYKGADNLQLEVQRFDERQVEQLRRAGQRERGHLRDLRHDRPHRREPVPRLRPADARRAATSSW